MKVSVEQYIQAAKDIFGLMPNVVYKWAESGTRKDAQGRWMCDCRGYSIIWVLRNLKLNVSCVGTNYSIRYQTQDVHEVASVKDIQPGMTIYKVNNNMSSLPDAYKKGGSRYVEGWGNKNCYHVGVVISTNPLVIYHCSSGGGKTGILKATNLKGWNYAGWLKWVDHSGKKQEEEPQKETVKAKVIGNGKLNLRSNPSLASARLTQIPVGELISVIEKTSDDWWKVTYNGKTGYVMRKFIQQVQ